MSIPVRAALAATFLSSTIFFAACGGAPLPPPKPWGNASALVAARQTPEEKKAEAARVAAAAKVEAERLQRVVSELEAASKVGDPAAVDKAAKALDDVFGPVTADAAAPQEPTPPERTALQRVFQDKTGKDLAAAFPNVSVDDFRTAFANDKVAQDDGTKKKLSLEGFNFGTGIGASFDMHSGSRVKSASIRDGLVRVDEEGDAQLGLVLETHYFFGASKPRLWGTGPFVAVKIGENDVIDEAGLGWMLGLRRNIDDTDSFNIGVGVMVDPDAEVLADGFTANQAPPVGATDVATKKEERFSFAIVFSYTF